MKTALQAIACLALILMPTVGVAQDNSNSPTPPASPVPVAKPKPKPKSAPPAAPVPHPVPSIQDTETKAQRDARMGWWREAKYGMFIHWGLYASAGGIWKGQDTPHASEWMMRHMKISMKDYQTLAPQFNPTKFDADAWVALAKAAGMKYIIITAKHHEGFSMYKTKVSPFNIVDATPFKRDPLQELNVACQKAGIKLGFYYSQAQDWNTPGGAPIDQHWDPAQNANFADYWKTKVMPQMEELLNNYQPAPAAIWFDTPDGVTPDLAAQMVTLLNKHPNVIWNSRLGGGYDGDTEIYEQHFPTQELPGTDWECCLPINHTWGFKLHDTDYKASKLLLQRLIQVVSTGGNFLLNVGPDGQGEIPAGEADRLKDIGKWLDVNGEAIYGTQMSPFIQKPEWGFITQKPGKLYLSVLLWPKDGKLFVPLANKVTKAYLLTKPGTTLTTTTDANGVIVHVDGPAPDPVATEVVLDIDGTPELKGNNVITLSLSDAKLNVSNEKQGGYPHLKVGGTHAPYHLGPWFYDKDYAYWTAPVTQPGKFSVTMQYSLIAGPKGSTLSFSAGDQTLNIPIRSTSHWFRYRTAVVGNIDVIQAGNVQFTLKGQKGDGPQVVNLRSIVLTPIIDE